MEEFHKLKAEEQTCREITPSDLSNKSRVNVIKYLFIIGNYSRSYHYLKTLELIGNVSPKSFDQIEIDPHRFNKKFNKREIFDLLSNVNNQCDKIRSYDHNTTKSSLLELFYNSAIMIQREAFLPLIKPNYHISLSILIIKYLEYVKECEFDGYLRVIHSNSTHYQYLEQFSVGFIESMIQNELFHILDCYKLLVIPIQPMLLKNGLSQYIISVQKRIIENPSEDMQFSYSFIEYLSNTGNKSLLLNVYHFCNKMQHIKGTLLCMGLYFSCNNPDKIEIRNNFVQYSFMFAIGDYERRYHHKPQIKVINPVLCEHTTDELRCKLRNFGNKYPVIFNISVELNREYEILKIKLDTLTFADYNILSEIIKFLNVCHKFLIVEQTYQPNSVGYFEAKQSYESYIV